MCVFIHSVKTLFYFIINVFGGMIKSKIFSINLFLYFLLGTQLYFPLSLSSA